MTSIKVKFRPASTSGAEGDIYYQVIHRRQMRRINTTYRVYPTEWNEDRSLVIVQGTADRKSYLLSIRELIRWDVERLNRIVARFESDGNAYSVHSIIDEFRRQQNEYTLFNYMESIIAQLKHNGKSRTAETYISALNSFRRFNSDEDIMLDSLSSQIMESYEAWHRRCGNSPNTISFYTRILRAVYHRAVEEEIIEDRKPFRHVYTGVEKTVKRAIPVETIKKIKKLNLRSFPQLAFARDMFMMSFYLRGMSFIDMAYLKKSDLQNGIVRYRRHKTRQQLSIEWTREMQTILNKYKENPTCYLLPIITRTDSNLHYLYRNISYKINRNLKKIAGIIGMTIPLTMYVARHSWASVARSKGIPIAVISEGMGHESEATTRIYLASIETSVVDRANAIIIRALK